MIVSILLIYFFNKLVIVLGFLVLGIKPGALYFVPFHLSYDLSSLVMGFCFITLSLSFFSILYIPDWPQTPSHLTLYVPGKHFVNWAITLEQPSFPFETRCHCVTLTGLGLLCSLCEPQIQNSASFQGLKLQERATLYGHFLLFI